MSYLPGSRSWIYSGEVFWLPVKATTPSRLISLLAYDAKASLSALFFAVSCCIGSGSVGLEGAPVSGGLGARPGRDRRRGGGARGGGGYDASGGLGDVGSDSEWAARAAEIRHQA